MKIKCEKLIINLDNSGETEIPYEHTYYIYSSILNRIGKYDPDLAENIHNGKTPQYVMSQLIPAGKAKFTSSGLKAKRFVLLIKTMNDALLDKLIKFFETGSRLSGPDFSLSVFSTRKVVCEYLPIYPQLVTRAPVILKNGNSYIGPEDEEFADTLIQNIRGKNLKIFGRSGEIKKLNITYSKRKISHIHGIPILSSIFKFIIDGDEDILRTVLCYGIGKNTQMGFGMVDILE